MVNKVQKFRELFQITMETLSTEQEFKQVQTDCREDFEKKLHDYGTAWRVARPETMTDQLFIKASRIRSLQMKGCSMVGEGIVPEFIGIVNYSIIALIQLEKGAANEEDLSPDEALAAYDVVFQTLLEALGHSEQLSKVEVIAFPRSDLSLESSLWRRITELTIRCRIFSVR